MLKSLRTIMSSMLVLYALSMLSLIKLNSSVLMLGGGGGGGGGSVEPSDKNSF